MNHYAKSENVSGSFSVLQIAGPHAGPAGRGGEVSGGGRAQSTDLEAQLHTAERHHPLAEHAAEGYQGGVQPTMRQPETSGSGAAGAGAAAGREY